MAGHGHGRGHEHQGGDLTDRGRGGAIDDEIEPTGVDGGEDRPDVEGTGMNGHGRSEASPGHLKKAAGEQSARDFAPGRARRA